ncbi:MAG TPA: DUF2188 domain-containing protein [Thermoanaerobaculia bacterium]|nr:DUF2188 domain-containing protein [Thermoanaerobaculia bacterium]
MASRNQHVVPYEDGWAVQSEGSKGVTSVFGTKREAIDRALEIIRRSGGEMMVHGLHGQVFQHAKVQGRIDERQLREAVRSLMKRAHAAK